MAWLLAIALFLTTRAHADVFIVAPATPAGDSVRQALSALSPSPKSPVDATDSIIIAVGPDSLQQLGDFKEAKVVATHLSIYTAVQHPHVVSVLTDPAPETLAAAIKDNAPGPNLGYLSLDPDNDPYLNALKAQHLTITGIQSTPGDLFKTLSRTYETQRLDALVISNDRQLFNAGNMSLVLESLFRKRVAAIAPIPALYRKGALLTVGPSQDAILKTTLEVVKRLQAGDTVSRYHYPESTSSLDVKVNQFLARHP